MDKEQIIIEITENEMLHSDIVCDKIEEIKYSKSIDRAISTIEPFEILIKVNKDA